MGFKPTAGATYERALRLANVAMWSIELQCRRLESVEPEDAMFVLRRWTDFDFLIVALTRLRRAARLAARIPQLQASLGAALAQFDRALPDLKKMRDVAEHVDDYALDQGRQKAVARQSLEVSTMEADGPTLCWLQARLNAREASGGSSSVFGSPGSLASIPRWLTDVTGHSSFSVWTCQALRARTAGRSAGVGKRRALACSVTTVTVLPVMSKNSTE